MAYLRWSGSMLLALLIILYWATSSARSHDLTDPSALDRVKRDMPYETRLKVEKSMEAAKVVLSAVKKRVTKIDIGSLSKWMKFLAKFANIAPGFGTAISAFANCALAFVSEENPVLDEVKKGFAEVNQKLESLSAQISNLPSLIEWNTYASTYSGDEVCILHTWKTFNDLFKTSGTKDPNHSAKAFVKHYRDTKTEACVARFYHYLTVRGPSLSRNINTMLLTRFQCSNEIGMYNFYFTNLLLKGTALNKVYWKLTGFNAAGKDAEHAQMFKKVFENQLEVLQICETKHLEYASNIVKEMAKLLTADKQKFANQVKRTLDNKYSWYNWVVLVYDKKEEDDGNIKVFMKLKIPIDKIIVALDQNLKVEYEHKYLRPDSNTCFKKDETCLLPPLCSFFHRYRRFESKTFQLADLAKVPYATYKEGLVTVAPSPSYERTCKLDGYNYKLALYSSEKVPTCTANRCRNNGICRVLLKSNDWLCECPTGYFGNECEESLETRLTEDMQTIFPLPVIRSSS